MSTPQSHRDVIELWPNRAEFARAISVSEPNARAMHSSGVIPPKHFRKVIDALIADGFPPLTYAQLADMARSGS